MKPDKKQSGIFEVLFTSPLRLAVYFLTTILLVDLGLDLIKVFLPPTGIFTAAISDGVSLVILLAPALYLFVLRPMNRYASHSREAEMGLRANTKKYNDLFEKSEDGNLIIADGKFVECNLAILKIFRYNNKQELLSLHASEISPEFQPEGETSFEKANEMIDIALEKGSHRFEWIHRRSDGEVFHAEVLLTVVDREKKIIHAALRDISEHKQLELERQVSSEITLGVTTTANLDELLLLIHHSLKKVIYAENCFFALYNPDTKLFSFPYFVDKYDQAPEPLALEKSCTAYIYRAGKSLLIDRQLFDQLKEQNEVELVGSNSPSWVGVPLKTSDRIIGVLVLQHYEKENIFNQDHLRFLDSIGSQVANVIERKRAEEKLRESEEKFRTFFEKSPIGIEVYNATGVQIDANKASLEMFGNNDKRNILKFNIFDGTSLSEESKEKLRIGKSVEYSASFNFDHIRELNNYKTDRIGKAELEYSVTPLKTLNEETIVGYLLLVQDITQRKQAEEALKESEARLHDLNVTKDKFFSIIAHDLRSPFNSIAGFSKYLVEQVSEKNYEEIEEYAEIIHDSSKRAMNLLSNLMEWSLSQTGGIVFNPVNIEMGELIDEVIGLSSDTARQKSITISRDLPFNVFVHADKNMISTVFRNLISNAIKFSNPGGKIGISIEHKSAGLVAAVSDNGIGIKKDSIGKLFRIDESFSTSGTQNEKGTGLGLILCKEFVEKNGGQIWAESEQEKGTTFYFTIPIQ